LSDSILLILHLELRFHCFFHLLPIAQNQTSTSMLSQEEMDRDVMEFGRDLTQIHAILQAHLTANKLKYLFDGLGYLCSSIFIYSWFAEYSLKNPKWFPSHLSIFQSTHHPIDRNWP
jgi:exocyst complex component 4